MECGGVVRLVLTLKGQLLCPQLCINNIPQTQFHPPVRIACRYIEESLEKVQGAHPLRKRLPEVRLIAKSDIDLWVLVDGDKDANNDNIANKLSKHLGGLQIPSTIALNDALNADFKTGSRNEVKQKLEAGDQDWASAQRYSFEILLETPRSIVNQFNRIDAEKLFGEGITLRSSETLDQIKQEVLDDE